MGKLVIKPTHMLTSYFMGYCDGDGGWGWWGSLIEKYIRIFLHIMICYRKFGVSLKKESLIIGNGGGTVIEKYNLQKI